MAMKNSVTTEGHTVCDEIAAMRTLASAGLSVHPERCVRLRNRHASCHRCADACTSGAIALEGNAWKLNPRECVACGTCATVCPTCALEACHPRDGELLRAALKSAKLMDGCAVFACSAACDAASCAKCADDDAEAAAGALKLPFVPGAVAEVTCLSRLDETTLFTLFSREIKKVRAVHADCASCARSQGCQSIRLVAETVQALSAAWGIHVDYERTSEFPAGVFLASADAHSKGRFKAEHDSLEAAYALSHATAEDAAGTAGAALKGAAEGIGKDSDGADGSSIRLSSSGHVQVELNPAHVQKDGTLPHFVPARRQKLLDALAALGQPSKQIVDTRLWGHVIIDFSRCKSCKMCAVFCPTGALCKYDDQQGSMGIEHYVAECVHCCLCQDICPGQAIACVTAVPAQQLACGETERYEMADPDWMAGPDQILQRMKVKIGGNSVEHSY